MSLSESCWIWKASRQNKGYGQLTRTVDGKQRLLVAHRHIYELMVGPVPPQMELDHVCRHRGCVNPAHLRIVSHRENMLAPGSNCGRSFTRLNALRSAKKECPRGHRFDTENTGFKRDGSRRCRACDREYARAVRASRERVE